MAGIVSAVIAVLAAFALRGGGDGVASPAHSSSASTSAPSDATGSSTAVPQIDVSAPVTDPCSGYGGMGWADAGEQQIGGIHVIDAVTCNILAGYQELHGNAWSGRDYILPSSAAHLTGILGIGNGTKSTNLHLSYEVLDVAGTKILLKGVAVYGKPVMIKVPVQGVIRISIRGRVANPAENQDASVAFVIGDLALT